MKTKTWILIFSVLALACAIVCVVFFFGGTGQSTAEVYSDGVLVMTLDLSKDGEYRIDNDGEWNILTVSGGKIRVSAASCPSQDCVHHSPADRGAPIVCLPNRMVIRFSGETELDVIVG